MLGMLYCLPCVLHTPVCTVSRVGAPLPRSCSHLQAPPLGFGNVFSRGIGKGCRHENGNNQEGTEKNLGNLEWIGGTEHFLLWYARRKDNSRRSDVVESCEGIHRTTRGCGYAKSATGTILLSAMRLETRGKINPHCTHYNVAIFCTRVADKSNRSIQSLPTSDWYKPSATIPTTGRSGKSRQVKHADVRRLDTVTSTATTES